MHAIVYLFSFLLLAGQGGLPAPDTASPVLTFLLAFALSIDVGGTLGNVSANDFLNATDTYLLTDVSAKHQW